MRLPAQKIHYIFTLLLAFSLPLERRIPPLVIIALFLNWLLDWNWKDKISNYKTHSLALLPCLLYLLYCMGMLYTDNIAFGMKDLETKLSLLILPLIYASHPSLTKERIHNVLYYFTLGCGLAIVICFVHSVYLYFHELQQLHAGTHQGMYSGANFFFSSQLSCFIHPSYFAMYLGLCLVYAFSIFFFTREKHSIRKKILLTGVLISFSITIVFLASKVGALVLLLTWLWAISFIILKNKYYFIGTGAFFLLTGTLLLLYKNSPFIASRLDDAIHTLEAKNLDKTSFESTPVRILIWEQAINLIKKGSFMGVGTGDVKDVLMEKYKTEGMTGALAHRLNAHNQFFQTGMAIGIPGLLLLFITVFTPLLIKKNQYSLLSFFFISIILNFSVESMLEIQAGVIYFSFFFPLLGSNLTIRRNE